jgi:glycosyltransferase involved in cell wall biosynthesis
MATGKNIWIVCINTQPPEYDTHLRHYIFAKKLVEKGYNVTVFGGSYMHYQKINLINDNSPFIVKEYDGITYVFLRINNYKSNGIKRICSIVLFSIRLFKYKNKFTLPSLIIHNLRTPFDFLVYFTAKKMKAKYVTEVWDLWPEAFVSMGLIKKNNPFLKFSYKIEKFLYSKADAMIFTMEGAANYLANKKWRVEDGGPIDMNKYHYINNGISLSKFNNDKNLYKIEDNELLNDNYFKVIYLGSIRRVNKLKLLIDAAEKLQNKSDIIFLIYGDGDERESLVDYCKVNNIKNVYFKEKWVDIKYVPFILSHSSLNILNYKPHSTLKYGGSQGKLFQYLASGKPICSNFEMGYDIIKKYNSGIIASSTNSDDYAQAILSVYNLSKEDYNKVCNNAIKAAKDFDLDTTLFLKFLKLIETIF